MSPSETNVVSGAVVAGREAVAGVDEGREVEDGTEIEGEFKRWFFLCE